ncbi:MAG: hypothetical protein ACK501_16980 [Planctomycetota bacterium]
MRIAVAILFLAAGALVEHFLQVPSATLVGLLVGMIAARWIQSKGSCALPRPRRDG